MGDRQHECLAAAEIPVYLDGGLLEGRKAEIERHLEECRLCGAAVEGVASLEWREGYLRSTESVLAGVRAHTATAVAKARAARRPAPRFRPAPQYLILAATLVLGVGAAMYLSKPGPGEALFQRYFEPYPSTRPIVRGAATDGQSNAMGLYEAHDYRGALAAFEASLKQEPNDAVSLFYAGLSRLALGQSREATGDEQQYAALSRPVRGAVPEATRELERALQLGEAELRAPAEWYLALVYLRSQDSSEARARLKGIAEGGGFYAAKARELITELDRLESGE